MPACQSFMFSPTFCVDGFNSYLIAVGQSIGSGGCSQTKRDGKLEPITDETKILYFLSDKEDPEEGNDILYLAISDIVRFSVS